MTIPYNTTYPTEGLVIAQKTITTTWDKNPLVPDAYLNFIPNRGRGSLNFRAVKVNDTVEVVVRHEDQEARTFILEPQEYLEVILLSPGQYACLKHDIRFLQSQQPRTILHWLFCDDASFVIMPLDENAFWLDIFTSEDIEIEGEFNSADPIHAIRWGQAYFLAYAATLTYAQLYDFVKEGYRNRKVPFDNLSREEEARIDYFLRYFIPGSDMG